jgi:hypothetical protein
MHVCVCVHDCHPQGRLAFHLGEENKNPLWAPGFCLERGGDLQPDTS